MSEPIAQRTLVKSPPELWAEISDIEALARHLGAFGEIRITRVVPETVVSWEGETARGTVELSASGWGTKVTLRATATGVPVASRQPADEPAAVAPPDAGERILGPPNQQPHWAASVEQKVRDRYIGAALQVETGVPAPVEATAPEPVEAAAPAPVEATAPPVEAASPKPASAPTVATAQPRGFLARIRWWFGAPADEAAPATTTEVTRAPQADAVAERQPDVDAATPPEPVAGEPPRVAATADTPTVLPFPSTPPTPEPLPEPLPAAATYVTPQPPTGAAPSAGPATVDEGTIVGILTSVLDELGSAHHRPFSRG